MISYFVNLQAVQNDPSLKFLAAIVNPKAVKFQFQSQLLSHLQADEINVYAIRLMRHKPGKRCLVEYDVEIKRSGVSQFNTWIGKVRAKGLDRHTYELQRALWKKGFQANSPDGISVPEPIGVIPDWQMWLQQKVPGTLATMLLPRANNPHLAHRIADAIHKLHQTGAVTNRHHGIQQELSILHDRLANVAQQQPQWSERLKHILQKCDRLAEKVSAPQICGIHRDFYPDQVLIDGSRIYLLDLDLYTNGDPGLDVGNFNGHLIEHSMRLLGHPNALLQQQTALIDRFVTLPGEAGRSSIEVYTSLTLVRHIYLSTQFPARRSFTEPILEYCEHILHHLI
jgi:aminoglycoside phosphotransferase (APT) family kinase protein